MASATGMITQMFTDHLIPLLAERGFTRSGSTFRRRLGTATQVVYLQRGPRNTAAFATFFLNGGVYLPALDEVIGRSVIDEPDEPSCHVRLRPDRVVPTGEDQYEVTPETDLEALATRTTVDLAALIDALRGFVEPDDAVAYLSTQLLAQYERVFGWYLATAQVEAARRFVGELEDTFGTEPRWQIFAEHLDAVSARVTGDTAWREWREKEVHRLCDRKR